MMLSRKYAAGFLLSLSIFAFWGCDNQAIIDDNVPIAINGWAYQQQPVFKFTIADSTATYNMALNLRHTNDYKYSNLFVLISTISPDNDTLRHRYEFVLANPDGRWLGDGSGGLYSYRIPFEDSVLFNKAGAYQILLEQNMRDNVLPGIKDVGIRIEKVKSEPPF